MSFSKKRLLKWVITTVFIGAFLFALVWRFPFLRFASTVSTERIPQMGPFSVEGYTDRPFYTVDDSIRLFIRCDKPIKATIEYMSGIDQMEPIEEMQIPLQAQPTAPDPSVNGCHWRETAVIHPAANWKQGFYRIELWDTVTGRKFNITFVLGVNKPTSPIAVIIPVTTWTAYNPWGGKSLYMNAVDGKNTIYVSTQRPNSAIGFTNDPLGDLESLPILVQIYNWYHAEYGADLIPDYAFEHASALTPYKLFVLDYHAEYWSSEMYDGLDSILGKTASMAALSGNDLYWKVRWHDNYTRLECHKDQGFFDGKFLDFGGFWKFLFRPQDKTLGVQSIHGGFHTYAPYKVLEPNHWLFAGSGAHAGELFGMHGVNSLPIGGSENAQHGWFSGDCDVIARAMNPKYGPENGTYNGDTTLWNGAGGGEIVLKRLDNNRAVLATGSIQSGSGLGTDSIYTTIVRNFTNRYMH